MARAKKERRLTIVLDFARTDNRKKGEKKQ
jgi:hypothetical protein